MPGGSVTASNSRAWPGLVVAGEPVVIPARVCNPEPSLAPAGCALMEECAASSPAVAALPIRKSLREQSRTPMRFSKTLNTLTSRTLCVPCIWFGVSSI